MCKVGLVSTLHIWYVRPMNEPKHTLAVLRRTIELEQKQMADLLGCSLPTIQAIEYGKLKLSPSLAETISTQAGVGLEWLLSNDVSKPILNQFGGEYSKEWFEGHQAIVNRKFGGHPNVKVHACIAIHRSFAGFAGVAATAWGAGKFPLFDYKVNRFLKELGQEFGESKSMFELERQTGMSLDDAPRVIAEETKAVVGKLFEVVDAKLRKPAAKRTAAQSSRPQRRRRA